MEFAGVDLVNSYQTTKDEELLAVVFWLLARQILRERENSQQTKTPRQQSRIRGKDNQGRGRRRLTRCVFGVQPKQEASTRVTLKRSKPRLKTVSSTLLVRAKKPKVNLDKHERLLA